MSELWSTTIAVLAEAGTAALGLGEDAPNAPQMMARAFVIYLVAIVLVRLGNKRFIGKFTAFDVILGIMLGSVLSRAITGSSPFFPTIAAGLALVALHGAFGLLAFRLEGFGDLIKGRSRVLVEDGEIRWEAMRRSQLTENDLLSALREEASIEDVSQVRVARLERSGNVSVILKDEAGG